jgi:hypothetical protein
MNTATKVILGSLSLGLLAGTIAREPSGSAKKIDRHPYLLSLKEYRDLVESLGLKKQFYLDVITYAVKEKEKGSKHYPYRTVVFIFTGDTNKNLLLASENWKELAPDSEIMERALYRVNTKSPMAAMRKALTILTYLKDDTIIERRIHFWTEIPGGVNSPPMYSRKDTILELLHRFAIQGQTISPKQTKEQKEFKKVQEDYLTAIGAQGAKQALKIVNTLSRSRDKLTKMQSAVYHLVDDRMNELIHQYEPQDISPSSIKNPIISFLFKGSSRDPNSTMVIAQKKNNLDVLYGTAIGRSWKRVILPKMQKVDTIEGIHIVPLLNESQRHNRTTKEIPWWQGDRLQIVSPKGILWLPLSRENTQQKIPYDLIDKIRSKL